MALALTSVLCLVTAPFFAPDETNQSLRAITLAHGYLLPEKAGDEAGDPVDTGVTAAMDASDNVRISWERRYSDFHDRGYGPMTEEAQKHIDSLRWSGKQQFVAFSNTAVYPPFLYIPAAIGWCTSEAFRLSVVNSLRFARLLSAWSAVWLCWWALRRAGQDGWLLLPLLLLPSTLFVQASSSQDALLLAAAAAFVAVVVQGLREARTLRPGELGLATVLVTACAMARPPYVALALLLLAPALEASHARDRKRPWAPALFAMAACAAVCVGWHLLVAPFGVDISAEANPAAQWTFLRTHSFYAGAALARGTAQSAFDFVHRGLYVIGWNDLLPHHGVQAILFFALTLLACCLPPLPVRNPFSWCLVLASLLLPLFGISLAEYLIWTPPGLQTVYGIQPRYWLPVAPLFGLLLACSPRPALAVRIRKMGLITAAMILGSVACSLPWFAAAAFYQLPLTKVLRLIWR